MTKFEYHIPLSTEGVVSPVEQNPLVDIGAAARPLRLAINTNQYGRTFQDRSHVYRAHHFLDRIELGHLII